MYVVFGLGNPGSEFSLTRHNIGFMAIDRWAEENNLAFRGKFQALVTQTEFAGDKMLLAKPQTFMNLSGHSLREIVNWYKLPAQNVIVIHDDMDLPFGKIRIRTKGSAGGHNGIKSIISELGTNEFTRIKVGIGRAACGDSVNYVLGKFKSDECEELGRILADVQGAVKEIVANGSVKAMNRYN